MDIMGSDRKVWTAMETRALITLKEEMKPKFQTMKRNRTLWIELSEKMRKHFGHERSPAQCAVRWKNIISAYKDSREALRNPRPDSKVCLFFKEVESIVGDPPLTIPTVEDARLRRIPLTTAPSQSPRKSERLRAPKDLNVASLLTELISKVDAQGAAIARIEKMLTKTDMDSTTPASRAVPSVEPIPVRLSGNVAATDFGQSRPYGAGDADALLERSSAAAVPDLDVPTGAAAHPNNSATALVSTRPAIANSVNSVPSTEQATREAGLAQSGCAVVSVEQAVRGDEVVGAAAEVIEGSIQARSSSQSSIPIGASGHGNDGVVEADGRSKRTEVEARPAVMTTVEQVVAELPKTGDVQGSDGSVGGSTDIDLISTGLGKEAGTEEPAAKKRKVVHTYA